MPAIDPNASRNVIPAKSRIKSSKKPPDPKSRGTAFTPVGSTRPFQPQQEAAQKKVDQSRRRLPAPRIAAPPIIANPTPAQTRAAKAQIVRSVRSNLGSTRGAERQALQARLLREIGTDPRLAATRRAIEHYSAAERAFTAPQTAVARAGRGDTRLGSPVAASFFPKVNLSAARRAVQAATPGLQSGSAPAQFVRNAGKDVGTLATAPFVAGLVAADIAGDVATGHPVTAAKKVGGIAQGVGESVVQDVKHPVRAVQEHPLLTLLNLAGAASLAGRGAGAFARGVGSTKEAEGLRGALARAGSTDRPSIALTEDVGGGIVQRRASKDLTRKGVQSWRDAGRDKLEDADGNVILDERGLPYLKPRSERERTRLANRRADTIASRANSEERLARESEGKARKVKGVRGGAARDIVAMVVEGTITGPDHFAADLASHVKRLRANLATHEAEVRDGRTPSIYRDEGEVERATKRVELGEKVLNNPRALAQGKRIVEVATEHGAALNRGDSEAAAAKLADPAELKRARLKVTAVEHLGAKHFTAEDHARAEQAARDAGDEALADAVSGKDQPKLRAHRAAVARVEDARGRAKAAQAEQARLEGRVRQIVGAQSVRRGQEAARGPVAKVVDGQRVSLSAADARRVGELSAARRSARAAKARRRAAERDLRKAQHEVRLNPDPKRGEGLRTAEGKQLTDKEIEDFLRSRGRDPESVAYLPAEVSNRQFHKQLRAGQGRGTLTTGKVRTGAAHEKGSTESSAELIRAQGVRQKVTLAKARAIDRLVGDHGMRHPAWAKAERGEQLTASEKRVVEQGGYFNAAEAAEVVSRAAARGERLVALRAFPAKLDAESQKIIREEMQGPAAMDGLGQRLLNDRFLTDGEMSSRARNVVVMSKPLVDRLDEHLKPASQLAKFGQILNKAFRYSVLPQPRWLLGNFVEPLLVRMPGVGSGINVFGLGLDVAAGVKTVRAMERSGDPAVRAAAKEIRAHQFGGLLFGERGSTNRRTFDEAFPSLSADAQKAYGKVVSRMPVVKSLGDVTGKLLAKSGRAVLAPLDMVFALNRVGEAGLQRAAFGKSVRRDIQEFTGSWIETLKLGEKAVEEAGRGLVNTATQQRFMHDQHELLGKYAGFSPTLRGIVQGPAPFLPWALNAARFVFWTMPAHRSAQTAILTQINEIVAKDWEEVHAPVSGLKGGLQMAIPNGKGGWVDVARYTPYGLTAPIAKGDRRALTSQFFPQIGGASAAIEGKDPFGRDLQLSTGEDVDGWMAARVALQSLIEATVPYAGTARRLREGGETSFADSTLVSPKGKPGSSHGMSAARRVWDPLRPTYVGGGGGPQEVVSPQAVPVSPREARLEKRAERLGRREAESSAREKRLERRAARLGRSG